MAVRLAREVGNTGMSCEHWVLVAVALHRKKNTSDFTLSGMYNLWKDASSYSAGKSSVRGEKEQVVAGVVEGNPTAGQMQSLLDNAIIAEGAALEGGEIV